MTDAPPGFELIACPCCGESRATVAHEGKDWALRQPGMTFRIVRCAGCGFCYLNPRPTLDHLGKYYGEGYAPYGMHGDDKPLSGARALVLRRAYGAPAQRPTPAACAFADVLIALRGARHFGFGVDWVGEGRLLDFGCGAGKFMRRMHALGWNVAGIDFSEVAVNSVRAAGLNALQGSLPHPDLTPHAFDVVTMRHALEHVPDPLTVLQAARDLLAPGGRIVIQVPNFASWEVEYFQDAAELLDLPRHLSHFTPNTLRDLLQRAGFGKIDVAQACYASRLRKSARLLKPGVRGPRRRLGWLLGQTWACRIACATVARHRGNELIATAEP